MFSIKIRVLKGDNRFGGRISNISFGSTSFKTPQRVATMKDYYAADSLPLHQIKIDNPISEYISDFSNPSFDAYLKGNGPLQRRIKKIRQAIDIMRYAPIMSTIQLPNDRIVEQKELKGFLDLFQNDPLLKIISIPSFDYSNIEEFKKVIEDFSEIALSRNQEAMPIIALSEKVNVFKEKFDAIRDLHSTGICNVIGFKYAKQTTCFRQLMEIYEHRDEEIWYHCFGNTRTQGGNPLAQIHVLQNWGLDTFSPKTINLGRKQIIYLILLENSTKPSELNVQRFDSPTLGILKEDNWLSKYGHDLHCNCMVCKNKNLIEFKDEYSYELDGKFSPKILRNASKVHELFKGTTEFLKSKEAINSDDLPEYYKKKEYAKGNIQPPE